jgi:GNAT superfamily N-acetyltransferase
MNIAYRGSGPNASWNTEIKYIDGDRTSESGLQEELAATPKAVLLVFEEATRDVSEKANPSIKGCVFLEPVSVTLWYLGSLTVDPRLQKEGLGRRILHAAEQWAASRGAHTIQMKVVHLRDTLIAWYLRRGYQLTGETQPFPYGDTRFGIPLRDDLTFVVLEKSVALESPVLEKAAPLESSL